MEESIYTIESYYEKYGKKSKVCEQCGKSYKLPKAIFSPRHVICFTCEVQNKIFNTIQEATNVRVNKN